MLLTKDNTGSTPAQLAVEKGHRHLGVSLADYRRCHCHTPSYRLGPLVIGPLSIRPLSIMPLSIGPLPIDPLLRSKGIFVVRQISYCTV